MFIFSQQSFNFEVIKVNMPLKTKQPDTAKKTVTSRNDLGRCIRPYRQEYSIGIPRSFESLIYSFTQVTLMVFIKHLLSAGQCGLKHQQTIIVKAFVMRTDNEISDQMVIDNT